MYYYSKILHKPAILFYLVLAVIFSGCQTDDLVTTDNNNNQQDLGPEATSIIDVQNRGNLSTKGKNKVVIPYTVPFSGRGRDQRYIVSYMFEYDEMTQTERDNIVNYAKDKFKRAINANIAFVFINNSNHSNYATAMRNAVHQEIGGDYDPSTHGGAGITPTRHDINFLFAFDNYLQNNNFDMDSKQFFFTVLRKKFNSRQAGYALTSGGAPTRVNAVAFEESHFNVNKLSFSKHIAIQMGASPLSNDDSDIMYNHSTSKTEDQRSFRNADNNRKMRNTLVQDGILYKPSYTFSDTDENKTAEGFYKMATLYSGRDGSGTATYFYVHISASNTTIWDVPLPAGQYLSVKRGPANTWMEMMKIQGGRIFFKRINNHNVTNLPSNNGYTHMKMGMKELNINIDGNEIVCLTATKNNC